MTPVSELPMAVRPKSRKEKNKLASRFAVWLLNILKQKAFNKYISLVLQSMPLEEKGAAWSKQSKTIRIGTGTS
jgi:hypothetical protein